MTTTTDPVEPGTGRRLPTEAIQVRSTRRITLRRLSRKVAHLDSELANTIAVRDALMVEVHAPPTEGGFTYSELAEIASLSEGRIIQIVQGKSEYSRAQGNRGSGAT